MNPTGNSNWESVAQDAADKKSFIGNITAAYAAGVKRLAEGEKKCIDLAVAQNAELTEMGKAAVQKLPGAPGLFLLDMTSAAFERFAEARKGTIDLIVEQSNALTETARERSMETQKTMEGAVSFLQQSMERSVAMQKNALDCSAAHTKAVFETIKKQFGITGGPAEAVANSFHRGVETVIDAQKEMLDRSVH